MTCMYYTTYLTCVTNHGNMQYVITRVQIVHLNNSSGNIKYYSYKYIMNKNVILYIFYTCNLYEYIYK